jgi:anti-sigma factor RsiW
MDCKELALLLERYFDGELDPALSAQVEDALAHCPDCQERLATLVMLREGMRQPIEAELSQVSFAGLWERVEAEAFPKAAPAPAKPGWWSRLLDAARESLSMGQLAALGAGAAAVAIVFFSLRPSEVPTDPPPDSASLASGAGAAEDSGDGNNTAWVSSVEVGSGFVIIDQVPSDPTAPLIVWHIEDDSQVEPDPEGQGG